MPAQRYRIFPGRLSLLDTTLIIIIIIIIIVATAKHDTAILQYLQEMFSSQGLLLLLNVFKVWMSILSKLHRGRAEEPMRAELERLQRLKANTYVQVCRVLGAMTGPQNRLLQKEVLVRWLQMLGELRHERSFDGRSKELLELGQAFQYSGA